MVQYWVLCLLTGQNYHSLGLALPVPVRIPEKDSGAFMRNIKDQIKIFAINLFAVPKKEAKKNLARRLLTTT